MMEKRHRMRSNVTTREAVETAIEMSKQERGTWDDAAALRDSELPWDSPTQGRREETEEPPE